MTRDPRSDPKPGDVLRGGADKKRTIVIHEADDDRVFFGVIGVRFSRYQMSRAKYLREAADATAVHVAEEAQHD